MSTVLLLIPSMAQAGGTERLVAGLSEALSGQYEIHVAAFDPPGTSPRFSMNAPFHALGGERHRPLALRWLTYLSQARALAALKRRLDIDVTISNLWRADLVSALSGGRDRKIALAHINVAGNPTNATLLRFRRLVGAIYRRFDHVVAVSRDLAEELATLYRLAPGKALAIENFVRLPTVAPLPPNGRQRLLWCGRFVPEKNLVALIDIFARIHHAAPQTQLILLGEGPERSLVEANIAAKRLSVGSRFDDDADVILAGLIDDPYPAIAGATLLMLPSRSEGLPMVLLEALTLGIPVMAADCPSGGVHYALAGTLGHDVRRIAVQHTSCGVLLPIPVNENSCASWAIETIALLNDPRALAGLGEGARARSRAFTMEAALERWRHVLA